MQKAAFDHADLLPFYGSSELVKPSDNKAADVFRSYPTGFEVFPVARVGASCLVLLQKLGGLGADLHGKQLAISISPSWFFQKNIPPGYYNGNFSLIQAFGLIYRNDLSLRLRHEAARRMLQYPQSLQRSVLLKFALHQLAAKSARSRLMFYVTTPFGFLERWILEMQDHFETLVYLAGQKQRWPAVQRYPLRGVDWSRMQAQASATHRGDADRHPIGVEQGPVVFLAREQSAHEWVDLELLLRGLQELGARPLFLSLPLNGRYFDQFGVNRAARQTYYSRVEALARAYHTPLVDFSDHDLDEDFLSGHHDHLSAKGWLYYDQALDDYRHQRSPDATPRL